MNDGTILLYKGNRKNLVDRVIMDVTDSPYSHTAIYLAGFTFESTVWQLPGSKPWMFWRYRTGVHITVGERAADLRLQPKSGRTLEEAHAGLAKAIEIVNSRAWYAFALTLFDAVLYPTRALWKWIYRKTGWAPFVSSSTNCSYAADLLEKIMGLDLWPGMPESLTVPGDYLKCDALEVVT
jgi:hypothetical protein